MQSGVVLIPNTVIFGEPDPDPAPFHADSTWHNGDNEYSYVRSSLDPEPLFR